MWTLTASGQTPAARTGDNQQAESIERALFEDLRAVLAKPEYGVTESTLGGEIIYANPHKADVTMRATSGTRQEA